MYCTVTLGTVVTRMLLKGQIETMQHRSLLLLCIGNMHTRVQPVFIHNAKILSKKDCDATLGRPNRSFVAFSYNISILIIRRFETPFE